MQFCRAALALLLFLVAAGCGSAAANLENSNGQLQFGVDMARMDLWREARFRFERALQIDPSSVKALNNLAVAYEGIGEFEKALDAYREALRLDRGNEYVQRNYSRFMEFYSRYEDSDEEGSDEKGEEDDEADNEEADEEAGEEDDEGGSK